MTTRSGTGVRRVEARHFDIIEEAPTLVGNEEIIYLAVRSAVHYRIKDTRVEQNANLYSREK